MKINAQDILVDFARAEMVNAGTPWSVWKALAHILNSYKEGDALKLYNLCMKFYNEEEVEIDSSDLELIKNAIKADKTVSNLVSGQLLNKLVALKND